MANPYLQTVLRVPAGILLIAGFLLAARHVLRLDYAAGPTRPMLFSDFSEIGKSLGGTSNRLSFMDKVVYMEADGKLVFPDAVPGLSGADQKLNAIGWVRVRNNSVGSPVYCRKSTRLQLNPAPQPGDRTQVVAVRLILGLSGAFCK